MGEDDAALLAAVAERSDRAFNTLIDRHQSAVRAFLMGLTAGPADADDIAQETFLALWTQARAYSGGSSVRAWLFAIAWRKAQDLHRRGFRRRRRDTAFHQATGDAHGPPAAPEDRLALAQALSALSLDQRAAVMLCLGCGFTHAEAADALGAPLGTVKSHVLRGRERLREVFGAEP